MSAQQAQATAKIQSPILKDNEKYLVIGQIQIYQNIEKYLGEESYNNGTEETYPVIENTPILYKTINIMMVHVAKMEDDTRKLLRTVCSQEAYSRFVSDIIHDSLFGNTDLIRNCSIVKPNYESSFDKELGMKIEGIKSLFKNNLIEE